MEEQHKFEENFVLGKKNEIEYLKQMVLNMNIKIEEGVQERGM